MLKTSPHVEPTVTEHIIVEKRCMIDGIWKPWRPLSIAAQKYYDDDAVSAAIKKSAAEEGFGPRISEWQYRGRKVVETTIMSFSRSRPEKK